MKIKWQWQPYSDLSLDRLYQILKLREAVFQIEQQCLYTDLDDLDQESWHGCGLIDDQFCLYVRVRSINGDVYIERVITAKEWRGKGLGRELMTETLRFIEENFPGKLVSMSAQEHLQEYYARFGFHTVGEPYDDEGIMHVRMEK